MRYWLRVKRFSNSSRTLIRGATITSRLVDLTKAGGTPLVAVRLYADECARFSVAPSFETFLIAEFVDSGVVEDGRHVLWSTGLYFNMNDEVLQRALARTT